MPLVRTSVQTEMYLLSAWKQFGGVRVAQRAWEAIPGGQTSSSERTTAVCAEVVMWYV